MIERDDVTGLTPAEEDPLLHRHLAALRSFGPDPLFDERVLSRVWRPDPEWLGNLRRARTELFASGRGWLLWAGVALGSLLPLAVLVAAGATFDAEIGKGISWFIQRGFPVGWGATAREVGEWLSQGETFLRTLPVHGGSVRIFAVVSTLVLAGCAWGLRRTMRPSGTRR